MKHRGTLPRVASLHVTTPSGYSGRLVKEGQHSFTYADDALAEGSRSLEVSLTMPLRAASYVTTPMLPVFQTFLPEGFLKERIVERFSKVMRVDDMALLALTHRNAIGRLRLSEPTAGATPPRQTESLGELLADQGTGDLFDYLADKYLADSGVSGVQPKVLVSTRTPGTHAPPTRAGSKVSPAERATLRTQEFIVKASGDDFPGLAENEYHCLHIARSLGLQVPDVHLSADRKRLVIERFDYDAGHDVYLGFEDMVSLQGKVNERKYEGSYENVAKAIQRNASPGETASSLAGYYASLVLSMALRNGDAHLKNYGLLYTDPASGDCRLSPLYDVVCTTIYIPVDVPALGLNGRRAWPPREALCEFGRVHCLVDRPEPVIDATLDAIADYRPVDDASGIWGRIRIEAQRAAFSLARPGRATGA